MTSPTTPPWWREQAYSPNNWEDHEKTYNDLMWIIGQKVHRQFLGGREGEVVGSQVEVECVEDERVDKEILDDGGTPYPPDCTDPPEPVAVRTKRGRL